MGKRHHRTANGIVSLIGEHLALLDKLGVRISLADLEDPARSPITIERLVWSRANNTTARLIVVDALAGHFDGLRKVAGHMVATFALDGVESWNSIDRATGRSMPLDENGQLVVRPASINCTTDDEGRSLLPIGQPMDCVVLWRRAGVKRLSGKALPLDLDAAVKNGWFRRLDEPTRYVAPATLFPVMNYRRSRDVVEGHAFHPSGKIIICEKPIDWDHQAEYMFVERFGVFVAIPLAQALENGLQAASSIVTLEQGPELGPDEFACGVLRGNVWEQLKVFDLGKDSSFGQIDRARDKYMKAKHPDKLRKALAVALNGDSLEIALDAASRQFAPNMAAFDRALEIRGEEWGLVETAIENLDLVQVLGEETVETFAKRSKGEDLVTLAVAATLKVPFDWSMPNHVSLRRRAIKSFVDETKVSEPLAQAGE